VWEDTNSWNRTFREWLICVHLVKEFLTSVEPGGCLTSQTSTGNQYLTQCRKHIPQWTDLFPGTLCLKYLNIRHCGIYLFLIAHFLQRPSHTRIERVCLILPFGSTFHKWATVQLLHRQSCPCAQAACHGDVREADVQLQTFLTSALEVKTNFMLQPFQDRRECP
jgi:hypothetical protein